VVVDALTLVLFAVGLVLLIVGAELLVRGASSLATAVGISPLVVGLTVVAFGTSSPELAVSTQASLAGQADLALGNVVGSNVFNVLFILGLSALIAPLVVSQQLVRLDVPLMIAASVLLLLLALDGTIGRLDGALLFAGIVAYTTFLIRQSRRESKAVQAEYDEAFGEHGSPRRGPLQMLLNLGLVVAGLALLVLGSRWLVDGAVAMATALGVSELVIGLTIVAAGTSLPEVATSILATVRGERDIAVGNVVGSSIYNILAILGAAAIVAPGGLPVAPSMLTFDIPVAIAVAVACLPIFFTGHLIARWEGALFLGYYVAYTLFLVLAATQHDALPAFSGAMLAFVLPLTAVTLVWLALRAWRDRPLVEGPTGR
jgi:cation:H+ antiporter